MELSLISGRKAMPVVSEIFGNIDVGGHMAVLVSSEVVGIGGISEKHQNSRCEV